MPGSLLVKNGALAVEGTSLVGIPEGGSANDCACCDGGQCWYKFEIFWDTTFNVWNWVGVGADPDNTVCATEAPGPTDWEMSANGCEAFVWVSDVSYLCTPQGGCSPNPQNPSLDEIIPLAPPAPNTPGRCSAVCWGECGPPSSIIVALSGITLTQGEFNYNPEGDPPCYVTFSSSSFSGSWEVPVKAAPEYCSYEYRQCEKALDVDDNTCSSSSGTPALLIRIELQQPGLPTAYGILITVLSHEKSPDCDADTEGTLFTTFIPLDECSTGPTFNGTSTITAFQAGEDPGTIYYGKNGSVTLTFVY